MTTSTHAKQPHIGVGLRHPHYQDAIAHPNAVDFLEIHAENFFMDGGAALAVLDAVKERYPISIHGTATGLGSNIGLSQTHLHHFTRLVDRVNPFLVSDHACFARSSFKGQIVHAGDLLPMAFNEQSLTCLIENIQQFQSHIGRSMLIENLSAYVVLPDQTMTETAFLVEACAQAGCQLLLDLNNLVVNARNAKSTNIIADVTQWIDEIPEGIVGELHLAGCTPVAENIIMVDDHSQPVPEEVWTVYEHALKRFGPIPTLIEWDTHLPAWQTLLNEANKARVVAKKALGITPGTESNAI